MYKVLYKEFCSQNVESFCMHLLNSYLIVYSDWLFVSNVTPVLFIIWFYLCIGLFTVHAKCSCMKFHKRNSVHKILKGFLVFYLITYHLKSFSLIKSFFGRRKEFSCRVDVKVCWSRARSRFNYFILYFA